MLACNAARWPAGLGGGTRGQATKGLGSEPVRMLAEWHLGTPSRVGGYIGTGLSVDGQKYR